MVKSQNFPLFDAVSIREKFLRDSQKINTYVIVSEMADIEVDTFAYCTVFMVLFSNIILSFKELQKTRMAVIFVFFLIW